MRFTSVQPQTRRTTSQQMHPASPDYSSLPPQASPSPTKINIKHPHATANKITHPSPRDLHKRRQRRDRKRWLSPDIIRLSPPIQPQSAFYPIHTSSSKKERTAYSSFAPAYTTVTTSLASANFLLMRGSASLQSPHHIRPSIAEA